MKAVTLRLIAENVQGVYDKYSVYDEREAFIGSITEDYRDSKYYPVRPGEENQYIGYKTLREALKRLR